MQVEKEKDKWGKLKKHSLLAFSWSGKWEREKKKVS